MPYPVITNAIGSYQSVLFLGPLFGVDNDGKKINKILEDYFFENGPEVDSDFQNLFILKKKDADFFEMATALQNVYNKIVPGSIYDDIAKIKFSAIVCFTQDTFLVKAFEKNRIPHSFEYYSSKGSDFTSKGADAAEKDLTVIYNVYGKYDDANSLIIDYESFYEFLFSILGNSNFFSSNLASKIAKANTLLFIGFDLKKWYVPLLVTKLYNIAAPARLRKLTVASTNHTDKTNEEYLQWLRRYPLQLTLVDEYSELISELINSNACLRPVVQPGTDSSQYKQTEQFYVLRDKWIGEFGNLSNIEETIATYDMILKYMEQNKLKWGNESGKIFFADFIAFFSTRKTALKNAQEQSFKELISNEMLRQELMKGINLSVAYLAKL